MFEEGYILIDMCLGFVSFNSREGSAKSMKCVKATKNYKQMVNRSNYNNYNNKIKMMFSKKTKR